MSGGNYIDINKYNGSLKAFLLNADGLGNNNRLLEGAEVRGLSELLSEALKNGRLSDAQLKEYEELDLTGLQVEHTAKTENNTTVDNNSNPQKSSNSVTAQYVKEGEAKKELTKELVEEIKKGKIVDKQTLLNQLDIIEKKDEDNTYRKNFIKYVKKCIEIVDELNPESKEAFTGKNSSVQSVKKQVKSKLKEDPEYKHLNVDDKQVLDAVVATFEIQQIMKEYKEIGEMFFPTKNENSEDKKETINYTEKAKQVESELKADKKWNSSYYKQAYKMFVDGALHSTIMAEIENIVRDIVNAEGVLPENVSTLKNKIKEKHLNGKDRMFNEAINDDKTILKIAKRYGKVMNKRKTLENVSPETMKKALTNREKGQTLFKRLLLNGLESGAMKRPVYNEDGTYKLDENGKVVFETINDKDGNPVKFKNDDGTFNLTALSEAIESRTGYDYLINGSTDKQVAEIENIRSWLAETLNYRDLTDDDARQLAKFCGFKIKEKDHTPGFGGVAGALAGGAASNLVGATAAKLTSPIAQQVIINNTVNINVLQNVLVNMDIDGQTIQNVIDQVTNVLHESSETITIDLMTHITNALRTGLVTAGYTGLALAAIVLLVQTAIGKPLDEKSCASIEDFDINSTTYTNKNNYVRYLSEQKPDVYQRLQPFLDLFKADKEGNWDYQGYLQLMRGAAGIGSRLNCEEIKGLFLKKIESKAAPAELAYAIRVTTEDKEDTIETSEIISLTIDVPGALKLDDGKNDAIKVRKIPRNSDWLALTQKVYNCDGETLANKVGHAKAVKFFKYAQCFKVTDQLKAEIKQKIEEEMKADSQTWSEERQKARANELIKEAYYKFISRDNLEELYKLDKAKQLGNRADFDSNVFRELNKGLPQGDLYFPDIDGICADIDDKNFKAVGTYTTANGNLAKSGTYKRPEASPANTSVEVDITISSTDTTRTTVEKASVVVREKDGKITETPYDTQEAADKRAKELDKSGYKKQDYEELTGKKDKK